MNNKTAEDKTASGLKKGKSKPAAVIQNIPGQDGNNTFKAEVSKSERDFSGGKIV